MNRSRLHSSRNIAAALLACVGFASCSQDDMPDRGNRLPDGKYPLSLTASIGSTMTRAVGMEQWNGGEEIAVSIDDYTGKYTMDADGKATPSGTPYYWQSTATATVSAWYPYAEGEKTYDISDQSKGYAAFDFLYAETGGSYAAPVQLVFSHRMAKVSYTLVKGEGITDTEFSAAAVTLFGDKAVTVSGGKITADPTSQTDEIKPCHDASAHTGSAVMVPQNMTGNPLIKVSISGNDFIYTPATEAAGNLQGGYQCTYTITVKADGIEVTAAKGGEWTDGGSEDVGITIIYDGTETEAKTGDYYYADGTWSDGGLRKLYPDGTMEWAEITPQPVSGKTCIGIVFYIGQHDTDEGDYSVSGIGQKKCHGYVVALTDVHNDDNDRLRWEYGPGNVYEKAVGASNSTDDWNGYSNCLKFHEFINKNEGWEMKHFPAAIACETYGNRTLDRDGNPTTDYDWQQPLAAPGNSSGWFLPSCGQLLHLYANRSLLSARMDVVKSSVPDNCNYTDKIKWFSTSWSYWSSTELSMYSGGAWNMRFGDGGTDPYEKHDTFDTRPILAF